MSERDSYPAGVPCWVDTTQPDPHAAQAFYGELFGWDFEGPGEMPGDPPGQYFVARLEGRDVAGIGSPPASGPGEPAWNTYVRTESADATAASVRDAGGTVLVEPFDAPPAGRMAVLADPGGARFCAWEAGVREGAQRVNEPGAWSMSALLTPDPDAAAEFYGAVFGWQREGFGGPVSMFRLPGYVGGEPEQPVPRDVVATMVATGDEARAPAHWRPDFWIGDIERAAATAAEHASVLEPPADVPGVPMRSALLADPSGAAFSVTQLMVDGRQS